jgi:hypothetical protein
MSRAFLALPVQAAVFGECADVRYQLLQSLSGGLISLHFGYQVRAEITPNRNRRKATFLKLHYENLTLKDGCHIVRAAVGRSLEQLLPRCMSRTKTVLVGNTDNVIN